MSGRLVILGLDGLTFDILKPMIDEGHLPTFSKLLKKGVSGDLISIVPPSSAAAWTTFMTGKRQGKHGIFDFLRFDQSKYIDRGTILDSTKIDSETFFHILSNNGNKVCGVNIPLTFPPLEVDGAFISGSPKPEDPEKVIYPKALKKNKVLLENEIKGIVPYSLLKTKEEYIQEIIETDDKMMKIIDFFLDETKYDLYCFVLTTTDAIFHNFWGYQDETHPQYKDEKYRGTILNYMRTLDKKLERIISKITKHDVLFVLSDHGFAKTSDKKFFFNTWLKRRSYLELKKDRFKSLSYWMNIFNVKKSSFEKMLSKVRLLNFVAGKLSPEQLKKFEKMMPPFSFIDWSKTKAYYTKIHAHIPFEGININSSRKPEGSVSAKEYDSLCKKLISELLQIKDTETNERIVEWTKTSKELFGGKHYSNMPDIILKMKKGYTGDIDITNKLTDRFIIPISGDHHPKGIFIACGKNIKEGKMIEKASLIDIAPTILNLFGFSVPKDMDGSPLSNIFTKKLRVSKINQKSKEEQELKSVLENIKL